jgi:copper chaperone CopZ
MAELTVAIQGMSCQHCVARVKKALDALAGVQSAEVTIGSARVRFDETTLTPETIKAAIVTAGYRIG